MNKKRFSKVLDGAGFTRPGLANPLQTLLFIGWLGTLFVLAGLWWWAAERESVGGMAAAGFMFMIILPRPLWRSIGMLRENRLTQLFPHDLQTLPGGQPLSVRVLWHWAICGLTPARFCDASVPEQPLIWLGGAVKPPDFKVGAERDIYSQGTLILETEQFPLKSVLSLQNVPAFYQTRSGRTGFDSTLPPGDCWVTVYEAMQGGREIRHHLLAGLVAGALLITAFSAILAYSAMDARREWEIAVRERNWAEASLGWPTAPGQIRRADLRETEIHTGRSAIRAYQALIQYEYQVDGRTYRADRLHFGYQPSPAAQVAHQWLERYPLERAVQIAYDPQQPERATLEPGSIGKTELAVFKAQRVYQFLSGLWWVVLIAGAGVITALAQRASRRLSAALNKLTSIG